MVNFRDEEERKGRTKPGRLFGILLAVMLAQIAAVLAGCASFVPSHVEDTAFERHAVSKEKSNVRVTVAVLTARESQDYFGVPLESKEIQAVWLKVENRNDYNLYIVPRSTDPNYYSAYEAAYVNHRPFARRSNEAMDQFFQRSRIKLRVPANRTNTEFLFTNLSEGTKFVNIEMVHDLGAIRDGFFFQLPNGAFDYEESRVDSSQVPAQGPPALARGAAAFTMILWPGYLLIEGCPEPAEFTVGQHSVARALGGRARDLVGRVVLDEVAADREVEHHADEPPDPVGLDRCAASHYLIEQRDHVLALDVA